MFERFCRLVYDKAGIALGPQKESLVSSRIGKRMRQLGIADFESYYRCVEEDASGEELVEMLNAISTNVTHFFREPRHFEILRDRLRQWEAAGQSSYRIWCAAASTGEEPYTIAMTVRSALRDARDVKILATDISTKVLRIAKAGAYEARHLEKVPDRMGKIYFRKRDTDDEKRYEVVDELKRMMTFARLNLAHPPYPMKGPFDVVFCRNVMIYFDNAVRKGLLSEAWRLLKPGGYLMVGHAESLSGMLSDFKSVEPSVYIKQ
jgi:chemotaxis protein methyltransferase CheR